MTPADSDNATLRLPTTQLGSGTLPAVTDLLPPAAAELVIMSDTHLLDPHAPHAGEFTSRMRQNDRIATALRIAAGTGSGSLVHLGDLVQDYPENATHPALIAEAVAQLRSAARACWIAAGNTDIGDKPDPSSPAAGATRGTLERFAEHAAPAWSAFDASGVHGLVLAASVFNSGLPAEDEQWNWITRQLQHWDEVDARWRLLCWHYPTFWQTATDPDLGNYDVLAEPARGRLIELIRRHRVDAVFTGHSHFAFLNQIGRTRCYGVPSTSFTRPGFSEMFSSAAPPDRGRDDVPKLGFHLVRFHHADRASVRVHQIRSGSLTERLAAMPGARPVLTGVSADLPRSGLGVVLRHPVTQLFEVPDVFPSVRRQRVRNDYPLLGCLELGARQISVAVDDAVDPVRAERLRLLRGETVEVAARLLWPPGRQPVLPPSDAPIDELELILLGRSILTSAEATWLSCAVDQHPDVRFRLATMMRTPKGSAELPRWRYGFASDEVSGVDRPDGVRLLLDAFHPSVLSGVTGADDVVLPLAADLRPADLAEAFLLARTAGSRFFVDGLTELDRSLDIRPGLPDRAQNPQPAFHLLAVLNSALSASARSVIQRDGDRFTVSHPVGELVIDLRRQGGPPSLPAGAQVVRLIDASTCPHELCDGPWLELPGLSSTRVDHER